MDYTSIMNYPNDYYRLKFLETVIDIYYRKLYSNSDFMGAQSSYFDDNFYTTNDFFTEKTFSTIEKDEYDRNLRIYRKALELKETLINNFIDDEFLDQ